MMGANIEAIQLTLVELRRKIRRLKQVRPGLVDGESTDRLLKLCKDIEQLQRVGDKLLSQMSQADRLYFKKQMPTAFALLGWSGRIDDDGRIVYDA